MKQQRTGGALMEVEIGKKRLSPLYCPNCGSKAVLRWIDKRKKLKAVYQCWKCKTIWWIEKLTDVWIWKGSS